jgi:hypothetical protein
MGKRRGACRVFVGKPEKRDLGIDGRTILKSIFKK